MMLGHETDQMSCHSRAHAPGLACLRPEPGRFPATDSEYPAAQPSGTALLSTDGGIDNNGCLKLMDEFTWAGGGSSWMISMAGRQS